MKSQESLFENIDDFDVQWREWQDMPEFIQEDLTSHRKIVVHFRNDEDAKKFSEIIKQKITPRQPSLWFPEKKPRRYAHLKYIDDEE